jgi:hypothetical protein
VSHQCLAFNKSLEEGSQGLAAVTGLGDTTYLEQASIQPHSNYMSVGAGCSPGKRGILGRLEP